MRWSPLAAALILGLGCGEEREGDDAGECSDGADNDLDGLFDCDDPNCAGSPDCDETTPTDPGTGTGTGSGTGGGTGSGTGGGTGSGTGTGSGGSGTGSGTGGTGVGAGTPGGTATCGTVSVFPTPGTIDAYFRTTIEADLSNGLQGTETISVAGVPGTQIYDGDRIVFTPNAPLSPSTQYDATLNWGACGPTPWSFTTGSVGAPVGPSGLVGSVYEFDLGNGRFVQPAGVGPLMAGFIEDAFLLGVLSANASTIDFRQAMGDGLGNQDTCAPTIDLTPADFTSDPYFQVGPTTIEMDLQGVSLTLEDATWSGAFTPSKDAVTGGRLDATLDMSALTPLVGSNPCSLLVTFGVTCQPCPAGNVDCIELEVDSIPAPRISTGGLTPRTWPIIQCDPACGTVTGSCP